MAQDPVQIVQGVYEAFGRGDVPAILALCAPDMRWQVVGQAGLYPLWNTFEGAGGGAGFFSALAANETFSEFTVQEIHGAGDVVTVLGHAAYTLTKTGRGVETDFVHIHRLRDGQIVSFREFSDTAQVLSAYQG